MRQKRNTRGEGCVEQLPSGLFRAVVKRHGQRIKGPAMPTRTQARQALREKLQLGKSAAARDTLRTFSLSWVEDRKPKLSPSTYATYLTWAKTLGASSLGSIQASKVSVADLERWVKASKLSPISLRKRLIFIHSILKDAGNPARAEMPRRERHIRRPLSPEERELMKAKIEALPERVKLAIYLCWYMGLRRSEACGLMHEDRDGAVVRIRRVVVLSLGEDGLEVHIKHKAKSPEGHGPVVIPPILEDKIGHGRKGYVLGDGKNPLHPKTLSNWFTELKKDNALALIPKMGAHALRRTYAMMLIESGADIITAAKLMRNDPKVLMDEYARSRMDLMIEAVARTNFG